MLQFACAGCCLVGDFARVSEGVICTGRAASVMPLMDDPYLCAGHWVANVERSSIFRAASKSLDIGNRGREEGENKITASLQDHGLRDQ